MWGKLSNDKMFGFTRDEYGWRRADEIKLFGRLFIVEAVIDSDDGSLEPSQREAYLRFERSKSFLLYEAERAIYSYYDKIFRDVREHFGPESADDYAPIISNTYELAKIVNPTQLLFRWSFGKDTRIVGLLCNCSWEPEHGLAVKFVDERVEEVGIQDIVL